MKNKNVRRWSSAHRILFRSSGGRVGKRLVSNDMLLLTTAGRHTGDPHTVPLLYLHDGDALVVIASYGGRPEHPEWYRNLVKDSHVGVRTATDTFKATARTASDDERTQLWSRVLEAYDGYRVYQERTEREIPVVVLERIAD